jgi:hypothetical protein
MSERLAALFGVLVFCGPSCTGTETDNPVADFDRSACKSGGSALRLPGVMATRAALTVDSADYEGLYCFAWKASDDGRMRLDVFNMVGGCHIDWELADARYDAKGLRLRVQNDECAVAGCGSCAYDLSFDLTGIDRDAPLPMSLSQLNCDDELTRDATTLILPIDERGEGVICREGGGNRFVIECGVAHSTPCAEQGPGRCADEGATCGDGLVCDPRTDASQDLCLTGCESDDDCPLPVEACVAGACRLRETF